MYSVTVTIKVAAASHGEAVKRIEQALNDAKRSGSISDTLYVDTVDAVKEIKR